jgi:hypothetical protein
MSSCKVDDGLLVGARPHRLRALIVEDLERFPDSGRVDIHRRIGPEIHPKAVMRALDALVEEETVVAIGERRWRKYRLAPVHGQGADEANSRG